MEQLKDEAQHSSQILVTELEQACEEVRIEVVEGVTRGHGISSYVGYIIKVESPNKVTVQRRYREFNALREVLVKRWPGVMVPCLPPKHTSGSNSLKIVNERVKYLSYFLNGCAKMKFVFMSEEFQMFLNSLQSDLKKQYEKMPALTFEESLTRYRDSFPSISTEQVDTRELENEFKDKVQPFAAELKSSHVVLVNLAKEVRSLAIKKEEEMLALRSLYNEALPIFQQHISSTAEDFKPIFKNNPQLQNYTASFKSERAKPFWILHQSARLEADEGEAALEAIESRSALERAIDRTRKQIADNQEEMNNIRDKKFSLKGLFRNKGEDTLRQLQKQNQELKVDLQAGEKLYLIVTQLIIKELVATYRQKRNHTWRKALRKYVEGEGQFNTVLLSFLRTVQSS